MVSSPGSSHTKSNYSTTLIDHYNMLYSGKFSWDPIIADSQSSKFSRFNFTDVHDHTHLYTVQPCLFHVSIFVDSSLSAKTAKIGPLENFPLYGTYNQDLTVIFPLMSVFTGANAVGLSVSEEENFLSTSRVCAP